MKWSPGGEALFHGYEGPRYMAAVALGRMGEKFAGEQAAALGRATRDPLVRVREAAQVLPREKRGLIEGRRGRVLLP